MPAKPKIIRHVINGWTYGDCDLHRHEVGDGCCDDWPDVFRRKGTRQDWPEGAWPPQRIRVTIEYLPKEAK